MNDLKTWKVGDRIRRPNYRAGFYRVVREVQERGLVVSLPNGSHKQLLDWECLGPVLPEGAYEKI